MRGLNDAGRSSVDRASVKEDVFRNIVVRAIHKELERPLDWRNLYSLSWLYALAQSMSLREEELYIDLKNTTYNLLDDGRLFKIAIYDRESAVGILFSLYQIADREGVSSNDLSRVLEALERLRWHEFDGEIMAFSYMLARRAGDNEYVSRLGKEIDDKLRNWFRHLDYRTLRSISYALFGFAYVLDDKLSDIVGEFKLYSTDSDLLRKIEAIYDIEPIALTLYALGRVAYSKKLRRSVEKKVGKNAVKSIRYKVIARLGNILNMRMSEAGILEYVESLPSDLLPKIQLARIEVGLDKPFILSKHEWKIYQEVLKASRQGYYHVHRKHLVIGLILTAVLIPSAFIAALILNPLDMLETILSMSRILSNIESIDKVVSVMLFVLLNTLYGINYSLYKHGYIKKEYLLGVIKKIIDLLLGLVKRG
ncbi:MAG: hypothetical protein ACP5IE_03355 [Infirmifilum sp.]